MYGHFMHVGRFLLETAHGEEPLVLVQSTVQPSSVQFSSVDTH
jgi:hypothetical protein